MTNISPQKPNLARRLWQRLGEIRLGRCSRRFRSASVVTGPVFGAKPRRLSSTWRVEVHDAFYKIIVGPTQHQALAFIVPPSVERHEPLDRSLVSVDAIERRAGFDFFHELDDAAEGVMEAIADQAFWHLAQVACLTPRDTRARSRADRHDDSGAAWGGNQP